MLNETNDINETKGPAAGVIEGSSRVLRELLRTPRVRKTFEVVVDNLDPENAPLLVRELMGDPAQFFAVLGAAPPLANVAIEAASELSRRMLGYPPALLAGFIESMADDVEAEKLGGALGSLVALTVHVRDAGTKGESESSLLRFSSAFARGFDAALVRESKPEGDLCLRAIEQGAAGGSELAAKLGAEACKPGSPAARRVAALAEAIRKVARENPAFVDAVLRPLSDASHEALNRAPRTGRDDDAR